MPKYLVHVHARDLLLDATESEGFVYGGVWAGRVVTAADPLTAGADAERRLLEELRTSGEIRNPENSPIHLETDEVQRLGFFTRARDTALVFYVDTDDPRNEGPS